MSKISTNILVLGKTGVGKSSFVNYIYGKKVAEKGAGKPVTSYGLSKYVFEENDITYNIYDSWGLEADKAEKWQKLITKEINHRNKGLSIKDWFHTIYYCFSATTARIEKFETDHIIRPLIQQGNKVTIIITHCDVANGKEKAAAMEKILWTDLHLPKDEIIQVCSEEKKLLGRSVKPFGREEVLTKMKDNLWDDIKKRLPIQYRQYIIREFGHWEKISKKLVKEQITFSLFNKQKGKEAIDRVVEAIDTLLKEKYKRIGYTTARSQQEASIHYYKIIGSLQHVDMEAIQRFFQQAKGSFTYNYSANDLNISLPNLFLEIIPIEQVTKLFGYSKMQDKQQQQLNTLIDETYKIIRRKVIPRLCMEYEAGLAVYTKVKEEWL